MSLHGMPGTVLHVYQLTRAPAGGREVRCDPQLLWDRVADGVMSEGLGRGEFGDKPQLGDQSGARSGRGHRAVAASARCRWRDIKAEDKQTGLVEVLDELVNPARRGATRCPTCAGRRSRRPSSLTSSSPPGLHDHRRHRRQDPQVPRLLPPSTGKREGGAAPVLTATRSSST